jgi:hypothetical protein
MSDSPIFDQLVQSRVPMGQTYEQWVKFEVPEFVWDPSRSVVQLDKQTVGKGVRFSKPALIEVWKPQPGAATPFGTLLKDYVEQVGKSFAEAHPGAVITRVDVKPNLEDNTLSLIVEGLHPTVKSLSAMDTAKPME